MTIKITAEELKTVWNLPGAVGITENSAGGYCALGKMIYLIGAHVFMSGIDFEDEIIINNTTHFNSQKELLLYYDPPDLYRKIIGPYGYAEHPDRVFGSEHPQWQRHILAFKRMLQKCIAAKVCELEDDAAKEFTRYANEAEENVGSASASTSNENIKQLV